MQHAQVDKLKARSVKCKFVGYLKETNRTLFLQSQGTKGVCFQTCHFFEKEFLLEKCRVSKVKLDEVQETQINTNMENKLEIVASDAQEEA